MMSIPSTTPLVLGLSSPSVCAVGVEEPVSFSYVPSFILHFGYPSELYIEWPHPCPWVLGGHGCDVIIHGRAWVGMGAIVLFMGGHGWASVLCNSASNSKSE